MVLLIIERVTPTVRGELTRWLIQPKTGVFVGNVSAMVRDKLWHRVNRSLKEGGAIMVYSSNTEQGFRVVSSGLPDRSMEDFEGLLLARTRAKC